MTRPSDAASLRERLLTMADDLDGLADAYVIDARLVAEVCDETLDRSGGLLGRVRQRVHESGRTGGYPSRAAGGSDE